MKPLLRLRFVVLFPATPKEDSLRFGQYQSVFRIARGGMAEVYAAKRSSEGGFNKFVAVKRMLPHLSDSDEFVTMFLDEARLASYISSPHVVQTLDLNRDDDGDLYIVMELVVGGTMASLGKAAFTQGHMLPIAVVVEMAAQAAMGLDDAHTAVLPTGRPLEIVHRDISPQNILVGIDGRARVTDFGIARAVVRDTNTTVGQFKGKFAYFSPEQAKGSGDLDARSDIFSLGIVAWEAITGRALFRGDTPLLTMERVRTMEVPDPSLFREEIDPAISRVINKALAKDVNQRYQTARDFAMELRDAARKCGEAANFKHISAFVKTYGGQDLERMVGQIEMAHRGVDASTIALSFPTEIDTVAMSEEGFVPLRVDPKTMTSVSLAMLETNASEIELSQALSEILTHGPMSLGAGPNTETRPMSGMRARSAIHVTDSELSEVLEASPTVRTAPLTGDGPGVAGARLETGAAQRAARVTGDTAPTLSAPPIEESHGGLGKTIAGLAALGLIVFGIGLALPFVFDAIEKHGESPERSSVTEGPSAPDVPAPTSVSANPSTMSAGGSTEATQSAGGTLPSQTTRPSEQAAPAPAPEAVWVASDDTVQPTPPATQPTPAVAAMQPSPPTMMSGSSTSRMSSGRAPTRPGSKIIRTGGTRMGTRAQGASMGSPSTRGASTASSMEDRAPSRMETSMGSRGVLGTDAFDMSRRRGVLSQDAFDRGAMR